MTEQKDEITFSEEEYAESEMTEIAKNQQATSRPAKVLKAKAGDIFKDLDKLNVDYEFKGDPKVPTESNQTTEPFATLASVRSKSRKKKISRAASMIKDSKV